jgi:hypothetical protein
MDDPFGRQLRLEGLMAPLADFDDLPVRFHKRVKVPALCRRAGQKSAGVPTKTVRTRQETALEADGWLGARRASTRMPGNLLDFRQARQTDRIIVNSILNRRGAATACGWLAGISTMCPLRP